MYLTREEERIYNGEHGWAKQVCMKILVKLGELFGASRLIPVESAHVSGVSYKTLGDAPTDFLEALANTGGKAAVEATLNPQSLDPQHLAERLPENLVKNQLKLCEIFKKMGFETSYTCTPYYIKTPAKGAHLAWAESSAVVYANSVLGAWTNREGGPSALAAAIIGKTPDCGIHRAENRKPKILVEVKAPLEKETDYGALGIYLGKVLEDKIPFITGLGKPTPESLKQLGAALASAGMVNMFHHDGAAAKTIEKPLEKITVEPKNLQETVEELTTTSTKKPDLVFVGCPHCSLSEIREIAEKIGDKKVMEGVEFWVCTSRHIKEKAKNYVQRIEASGAKIITDTCAVVTWTDRLGVKTIITNSAKTAHYAPTLNKAEVKLASLEECLKTALKE
ncbi:MAG: aconitase X catalytic domain-containing protein [Candidatus Bathyarchaeota archaeon]|nr:aconitase X catalytic domain-containing protein [Candidatus Bathyarchaeota archaeon]MDW8041024.1 aconitase X catalytic domain-containing protein [Nitrososphaerota archaeon]